MERAKYLIALKTFYAFYALFAVLPLVVSLRSIKDALTIPLVLFFIFVLYLQDRRKVTKRV